jgi:hypothetical protein
MLLAHPLDQPGGLPFSPVWFGAVAAILVWTVAYSRRDPAPLGERTPGAPLEAWEGKLSTGRWVGRTIGIALLMLCIVAGRIGATNELDNLSPALAIGFGWPILILASALFADTWRSLDPWDGAARLLADDEEASWRGGVAPAAVPALAWAWYLFAFARPLEPRSVGLMLAVYTIVTLAGCLALGRRRWMSRVEFLGIFLSWVGRSVRHSRWDPPEGAELVLGVLAGGAFFGALRYSSAGAFFNRGPWHAAAGLVLFAGGAALICFGLKRLAGAKGTAWSVPLAAIPAVASLLFATGLARNRLFTSVQLLPSLLGDPLGKGWDLLGTWGTPIDPNPLGTTGRIVLQTALVVGGHLVGAFLVARTTPVSGRVPAAAFLSLSVIASVVAVSVN